MKKYMHFLGHVVMALSLVACGGGGGSSNPSATPSSQGAVNGNAPAVAVAPALLNLSSVEGVQAEGRFVATITTPSGTDYWVGAEENGQLIASGDAQFTGENTFEVVLQLTGDLPAGTYESEILLHFCRDQYCDSEFEGSPYKVPVRYAIKPNIHVPSTSALRRSGREAAPSDVLHVDIPAEAGQVTAQLVESSSYGVINASLNGADLNISTVQARAGTYTAKILLQSDSDTRYRRTVDVSYVVSAPAGGETVLSADQSALDFNVRQGEVASARVKVKRPTWTDVWTPPTLLNAPGIFSLKDLGNDECEVSVNAAGADSGTYQTVLRFDAGPTGGRLEIPVSATVNWSFSVGAGKLLPTFLLTNTSTDQALLTSAKVETYDGMASTWTAQSVVPWLIVTRGSGTTGVDELEVRVDKTYLPKLNGQQDGAIVVRVNRPGTSPVKWMVSLRNEVSFVKAVSSGSLVGAKGRVFISGSFDMFADFAQMLSAGQLKVEGATVDAVSGATDPRMLTIDERLQLDVSGARPGQPITVTMTTPLLQTQVQIPVVAAAAAPSAYLALPFGSYRPPVYSPALKALYWAGQGQVYRWAYGSGNWQLSQTVLDGVIDVAMRSDDARLYAVAGRDVIGYDPVSLAPLGRGMLWDYRPDQPGPLFDAQVPVSGKALVFLADGRAFGSLLGDRQDRGTAWISSGMSWSWDWDLADAPHVAEPGYRLRPVAGATTGSALVRSASGRMLMAVDPDGMQWSYSADLRDGWNQLGWLPQGVQLSAVSDQGTTWIRTDGVLQTGSVMWVGNLSSKLPSTHTAGGFGLTGDGRFALIYGYRVATEAVGARARDAAVWVVDLQGVGSRQISDAPVVATLPLQDALGCTATLVQGETCRHQANLTVDGSASNVFVVGPRGVASAALPVNLMAAAGATTAAKASPTGRAQAQSLVVRRSLKTRLVASPSH